MMKAESPLFYTFYSFAGKTNKEQTNAETTSLRLKRNEMKIETKHEKFFIETYKFFQTIPYIHLLSYFSCPYIPNPYIKTTGGHDMKNIVPFALAASITAVWPASEIGEQIGELIIPKLNAFLLYFVRRPSRLFDFRRQRDHFPFHPVCFLSR